MPRRDKTGPEGEGPKTGRGLGDCDGSLAKKKKDQDETLDKLFDGPGRGKRKRPLRDGGGGDKGPGLGRRNRRGNPN